MKPKGERQEPGAERVRVRFGLRAKLLLWTLTIVNAAFLAVWLITTATARSGMVALTDENLGLGAQNLADAVAQLVDDTFSDGLTTSRLDLPAQAIETGDPKNIAWYSDEMVQAKGRYAAILVANRDGKIVSANTYGRDGKRLTADILGRSLDGAPWAAQALVTERGKGVWVPPSAPSFLAGVLSERETVAGFCFPVFDILDDRIGTLTIFLSLDFVGKQLSGYVTGEEAGDSAALVVDGAGAPVALPPNLPRREQWRAIRLAPGSTAHASLAGPGGVRYLVALRPVGGGAARQSGFRVLAMKTAAALEAPVDAIGNRLLFAFLVAVLLTTAVLALAADRFVRPVKRLTQATRAVDKASEYEPLAVSSSDEVGELTASFNAVFATVRDYEQGLEGKVAERTRDLAAARQATKDLLDNMRQGVFTVEADGRVGAEFSAFTREIFGDVEIAGADATGLLQLDRQPDEHAVARMRFWLDNIFGADELQWLLSGDDGIKQLACVREKEGKADERVVEVEYAPMFKDGAVSRVMMIAKDVTELKQLERAIVSKERAHKENLARIAEIAAMDAELFATFVDESRAILDRCDGCVDRLERAPGDRDALDDLFRAMHTLKGNARIFKITTVQDLAHSVEDDFQKLRDGATCGVETIAELRRRLEQLGTSLADLERLGRQVLFAAAPGPLGAPDETTRRRAGPVLRVSEARILELRRRFKDLSRVLSGHAAPALESLGEAVQSLTQVPLGDLFERFRQNVRDLGRDLGKRVEDLEVAGADIAVDAKLVARMQDVMVHSVRNALDHGIEPPETRRAAGKPEKGRVAIRARWEAKSLVVEVHDDGAGFDVGRLKRRALERRFVTEEQVDAMDRDAALALAFLPGVSTSDEVTEVSGRGVGMDVIQSVMKGLHGRAKVSSVHGEGSVITLEIPADYYQHL